MPRLTPEDFNGLASKLDSLDLTENELAILSGIIGGAAEDEVSGYASRTSGAKPTADSDIGPVFNVGLLTNRASEIYDSFLTFEKGHRM